MFLTSTVMTVLVAAASPTPEWLSASADAGYSADMLAYACLSVQEASDVLRELQTRTELVQAVVNAKAHVRDIQAELATLKKAAPPAEPERIAECSTRAETAKRELREQLDRLFDAGVLRAPESKRDRLRAWRGSAGTKLPAEFRVIAWSSADLKATEEALQAEQKAIKSGKPLAAEHSERLLSIRARNEVTAAVDCGASNLQPIKQLFDAER